MAAVTIHIDAIAPRAMLERLTEATSPAFVLRLVGARLLELVDENFRTKGKGRWKPLAWSTVALRTHGGSEPLQDINYRQSFVSETDGNTYVEVGSNFRTAGGIPLAKIHEKGTGPYTIRIRNKRVLAARLGQGAGGSGSVFLIASGRPTSWLFFGKEVHHPGVPARPVLPTESEASVAIPPVIEGAWERVAKGEPESGGN